MVTIVNEAVEAYASGHSSQPDPLLAELAQVTRQKMKTPGMMSGQTVGLLLNIIVHALGAKRVLEVGTFTGYSALMMAAALPADGRLITCDVDQEATAIAKSFWARSPHGRKIELRLGPALDTMQSLRGPFDFIFIDADKESYAAYYRRAVALLADRGLIAIDNMLWGGAVLKPRTPSGRAIAELADIIQADERVQNVLLTVRDGLMLVRKA
jgi:caffeoyl-CoA O-methyltransferase